MSEDVKPPFDPRVNLEKARAAAKAKREALKVQEQAVEVVPEISADVALTPTPPDQEKLDRLTYLEEVERIRKTRKPFGSFFQKLALPTRPGYHRHWFNDVPGRIDEAKLSGWTHVTDDQGSPVRRVVSRGPQGGLYGYAMEIPSVFWEEDRAAKREAARRPIEAIKSSPFKAQPGQSKPSDKEKFYSPREEVVTITKN